MSHQNWVEPLIWRIADGTAVANTATETSVFGGTTLPAFSLDRQRVLRMSAYGRISNTGAPTIRFRVRYGTATGGVILVDTGALTMGAITANSIWCVRAEFVTRSDGSSGTVFGLGTAIVPITGSSARGTVVQMGSAGETAPAAATIDTTADTAFHLTALWGTASASNTLTGHHQVIEVVN